MFFELCIFEFYDKVFCVFAICTGSTKHALFNLYENINICRHFTLWRELESELNIYGVVLPGAAFANLA